MNKGVSRINGLRRPTPIMPHLAARVCFQFLIFELLSRVFQLWDNRKPRRDQRKTVQSKGGGFKVFVSLFLGCFSVVFASMAFVS